MDDAKDQLERTVTVEQLAQRLQVHPNSVYSYIHRGLIVAFRIGNRIRIAESEARKLYAARV